jgi:hypothetical protein
MYAQEPIFVVTFWWGGLGFGIDPTKIYVKYCTSYAYRELTIEEFPIAGGYAYGFLKSLTGFDTSIQIDGFGHVSQLSAEFIDYFGHFRYWMASRNIYTDIMVEVGLFFRNPLSTPDAPLKGTIYKVFEGRIREPVVWNEADRSFRCDFVTDTWFKEVGYVPNLQDIMLQRFIPDPPMYNPDGVQVNIGEGEYEPYIDTERLLLQQNINNECWPQLFGYAKDISLRPIAKIPEFEVANDTPCRFGYGRQFVGLVRNAFIQDERDAIARFENAALVIPLNENNQFFMAIQRDYVNYPYNPPPGYEQPEVPQRTVIVNNYKSMYGLPQGMMTVDIESEGETIRCAGYLIDNYFVVPEMQYFNIPIYTGTINCKKIHQSYENPDYIHWQDHQIIRGTGKLSASEEAFAAQPVPPQWINRPDYEPNMLLLPSVKIKITARVIANATTLNYAKFFVTDENIGVGWYFIYDAYIYVVTAASQTELVFTPPIPSKLAIEIGEYIDICASNTPWLQDQYIAIDLNYTRIDEIEIAQSQTPTGEPLYKENSNLTINSKNQYGDANEPYHKPIHTTNISEVLYAKVQKQIGAKIYIENLVNTGNIDMSKMLMDPKTWVTTISSVTGNLRLIPNSMDMRIKDNQQIGKTMNQMGDQRHLESVSSQHTTVYTGKNWNDIALYHVIRAGAKLRIVDWWATHTYVITTEIGQDWEFVYPGTMANLWYFQVYLDKIWAEVNGRPVLMFGPKSGQVGETTIQDQFRRNDYFELTYKLFFPAYRDSSAMCAAYGGIYYPTGAASRLDWPNHVSITLYPTPFNLMLQGVAANNQQIELKAAACNTLNTDERIFKAVLENHTPYFYGNLATHRTTDGSNYDTYRIACEHQNMAVITEQMDVREFLAKLAWENVKHIQIRGQYAAMVDFFKMYNPMVTFDANNIDAKSISLEYVPFENLITQYNITLTNGHFWVIRSQARISPYDYTNIQSLMIGRDFNVWKKKDIKIMFNQTFRPDDFNITEPLFDGYMKLSNLYPQFLLSQKPDPLSIYPIEAPNWIKLMPLYPVEWIERSINSVLHWWLHYESKVWTVITFKTYVDENNQSFYLRAGDLVAIKLDGPNVKLFEDEQPPKLLGDLALPNGYPMENIDQTATTFDHTKIAYYTQKLTEPNSCSGMALVLSTNLDPEEWLITVKLLLPITAEGTI